MAHYIFDLDGTLANCDHRQEFALSKDWDEFHRLCHMDDPYPKVIQLLIDLSLAGNVITVVTGRDELQRDATLRWFRENGIAEMIDDLHMRPVDNRQVDHIYKLSVVDRIFGSRDAALKEIVCWFEDRDNLVASLRDAGFTILQVKAGAY